MDEGAGWVFVSGLPEDSDRLMRLISALKEEGLDLRFGDFDLTADNLQASIDDAIRSSSAVLVAWSREGLTSDSLLHAANVAASLDKLVPVTLDGYRAIPEQFLPFQTVDLKGWSGAQADKRVSEIATALRAKMDGSRGPVSKSPPDGLLEATQENAASEPVARLSLADDPVVVFSRLDDASKQSIELAAAFSNAVGGYPMHTEQLLLGLFHVGDAATHELFDRLRLHDNLLQDVILEAVGSPPPPTPEPIVLSAFPPLSRHATEALERALDLAADRDAARIGTWHLLRGLFGVEGCGLVRALTDHGVTADPIERPERVTKREYIPLLIDEPVGIDADELGRRGVAEALDAQLKSLVATFPNRSFLFHVDGAWGAGKSTLLRFLSELVSPVVGGRRPRSRWLVVFFDSWRQSRAGPPWLTLLQAIRRAVRTEKNPLARALFSLRERVRLVGTRQWVAAAFMTLVAVILVAVIGQIDQKPSLATWGDVAKLVGSLVPITAALWLAARSVANVVTLDSRRSARTFEDTRSDPMEDLVDHFGWVMRQAKRPVLVLVDDLDRCAGEFVVELLDVVQKLMRDVEPLGRAEESRPSAAGLLVVVAADGRWIRTCYDNTYEPLSAAVKEPGATVGTLFVEKLFQVTVPVPQLSQALKEEFFAELLGREPDAKSREPDPVLARRVQQAHPQNVLGLLADVSPLDRVKLAPVAIDRLVVTPDAQAETEHILEPYAPLLDPTPRAMKRFIMAYSMLRAVRLAEGSVVGEGPLALWTVVLTRWPLLAEFLRTEPAFVRFFGVPAEKLPELIPPQLIGLFVDAPHDLKNVMNHADGPLNEQTIRECCGEVLSHPG